MNRSKLRMPDDLGVYDVALKNLTSSDAEAEFASANYFVFPTEVLMFLMIRKRLGMPEINTKSNALLSLGFNSIPDIPVKYPSHDIVDDIFDKLYTDNPDYLKM